MAHLSSLVERIPERCPSSPPNLRCCCERPHCAYLKHNISALDGLEREVKTAASLGQALLARHEQYLVDAERDRGDMSTKIEQLEHEKKELEASNAKTVEENRVLIDQLEGVNTTVSESEVHIKSLEATLQSAQQEVRRLETLAARTLDLEAQLAVLEQEQAVLQRTVVTTEAQERSAIQRWKKAERGLCELQDQLERIDKEAREEREHHVEVMGRVERQRAVERELDTAAGRLKGAAAATAKGQSGSNVVSHFVKDILQDNANLLLGIMELREMLMNSNDEVSTLREQLLLHQPMEDTPTLRAELAEKEPKEEKPSPVISQALHIHHHYHTPKEEIRRLRKKRTSLNTALFTPLRGTQSPRTPRNGETANAILSQTSVTIPTPATPNRWSMQSGGQMSDFAPSSVPSSPQSMYRNSALFDRGFDVDSSRPTSPGSSIDPVSPQFPPLHSHRKRGSKVSTHSFTTPQHFQPHNTIQEENDSDHDNDIPDLEMPSSESLTPSEQGGSPLPFKLNLHRTTSHESILSISGLDIHTLKSRPSQMTTMLLCPQIASSNLSMSSGSNVTAQPTLSRQGHDSRAFLRGYANSQAMGRSSDVRSIESGDSGSGCSAEARMKENGNRRGREKTGGWVWGKWGIIPSPTGPSQTVKKRSSDIGIGAGIGMGISRPPGINQKGPIPGFGVLKTQKSIPIVRVQPEVVDTEALREGLESLDELGFC